MLLFASYSWACTHALEKAECTRACVFNSYSSPQWIGLARADVCVSSSGRTGVCQFILCCCCCGSDRRRVGAMKLAEPLSDAFQCQSTRGRCRKRKWPGAVLFLISHWNIYEDILRSTRRKCHTYFNIYSNRDYLFVLKLYDNIMLIASWKCHRYVKEFKLGLFWLKLNENIRLEAHYRIEKSLKFSLKFCLFLLKCLQ